MRTKTKILVLALAAAVLALLITRAGVAPAATQLENEEVTEREPAAAPSLAFKRLTQPTPNPHMRHSALDEPYGATAGASGSGALPGEEDDEDPTEDPSIYTSEPTEQFRQWRRTLIDEIPDRTWADQLRSELARRIEVRPSSKTTFHQMDCRETICRLYLQTNDALAARAVMATPSESPFQIEHQQLAAHVRLEDAPKEGVTYELLVRRDRPSWMPPHVPGAGPAYFQTLASGE